MLKCYAISCYIVTDKSFTFIRVPDDGSAQLKCVAYWHNLRVNDIVCKIYIYTVVCMTVFIITVCNYFLCVTIFLQIW
jgi:hypothetical protein